MAERTPELHQRLIEVTGWYDGLDDGHDRRHVEAVVQRAVLLAEKYASDQVLLAEIAAVYHDVGLLSGRDDHENTAAEVVLLDPVLRQALTHEEVVAVSRAVRNHRASTGKPETVLEKIIADADRSPISTAHAYMRAVVHRRMYHPEMDHEVQLLRAAKHLFEKYGPGGYGSTFHFKETEDTIQETMQPIFDAHRDGNLALLREILDQEGYRHDSTSV